MVHWDFISNFSTVNGGPDRPVPAIVLLTDCTMHGRDLCGVVYKTFSPTWCQLRQQGRSCLSTLWHSVVFNVFICFGRSWCLSSSVQWQWTRWRRWLIGGGKPVFFLMMSSSQLGGFGEWRNVVSEPRSTAPVWEHFFVSHMKEKSRLMWGCFMLLALKMSQNFDGLCVAC